MVVVLPVHGIEVHIVEDVVHPPHVPLEPEAEPAEARGLPLLDERGIVQPPQSCGSSRMCGSPWIRASAGSGRPVRLRNGTTTPSAMAAAGGASVAPNCSAPRAVERVFHHGQER